MSELLVTNDQNIEVTKKNIKNMYFNVRPSEGRTAISAPKHISDEAIHLLVLSKLDWIKKRSEKVLCKHSSPRKII